MSLSPYVIAKTFVYWKFPTSAERLAYVATTSETTKVAWQLSDNSFWMLGVAPNTWLQLSNLDVIQYLSNTISIPTEIPFDHSAVYVSYLNIEETFTVNGNVAIIG